jgi:hypothetical protein
MSFKCKQTLRLACHSLKESQNTETVDCFTLLLCNPASKLARSKSSSYGKMSAPGGSAHNLGPEGKGVNTVKCSPMKLRNEIVQIQFLM